ncbi:hypothetical protein DPMN_018435 [Dreissena polymorpha]|uniref:C1q domain-containing protein n=1 Tax=Dreissena polymorpha TaxID=45954 RepID=A0A9D4NGN0_DREPO|nr:hypothetical protein DPMN_018435 [Dreissena polymorpha]
MHRIKSAASHFETVLDGHGTEIPDGGVAFSASLSSNTHFRSGETLIFENVLLNTGSGFDSRSGEFKAPSSGIYLFSVTVRAQFHITVSAVVEKKGRHVGASNVRLWGDRAGNVVNDACDGASE